MTVLATGKTGPIEKECWKGVTWESILRGHVTRGDFEGMVYVCRREGELEKTSLYSDNKVIQGTPGLTIQRGIGWVIIRMGKRFM